MTQASALPWFLHELRPSAYMDRPYLVLDFETTAPGLDNFGSALDPQNDLVLACWRYNGGGCTVSAWGGVYEQYVLVDAVNDLIERRGVLVAHNAKYELQWLVRLGIDIDDLLVFDTKIAEYVLLGNLAAGDAKRGLAGMSTSLDACCKRRGFAGKEPVIDMLMKDGVCPSTMPRSWLEDRCRRDVEETELLFLDQREHLRRTNRLGVQYTRCLLTPVLAQMEFNGMNLDADRVEDVHAEYADALAKSEAEMDRLTGGINTNSPQQMATFIYDTLGFAEPTDHRGKQKRTKAGNRPTDKATIESLVVRTEKQRQFKDLRLQIGKLHAALSKNLDFFLGVCRERDGIFHAQFNQTTTATHRLSSSGMPVYFGLFECRKSVQFQNLPRSFKRLFTARRAGWLMFEADGSQLEFRVAAHLGRDLQALQDILDPDFDAHVFTASVLTSTSYDILLRDYRNGDKRAKGARQDAKADTFKPLYGGQKGTPEQERYYAEFRKRYRKLARTQEQWLAEVQATGRLVTEWGMRYYFPHADTSRSGFCNVTSAVYNYPVQALATAEIIPIAVAHFWHRVQRSQWREQVLLTNTVHDSIIGELAPEAVEPVRSIAKIAFGHDVYRYLEEVYGVKFTVPLGVGFTVGTHWGEGKEESYNIPAPYSMEEAA